MSTGSSGRLIERSFGLGRGVAARQAIVLAGGARLSVPADWHVDATRERHRAVSPVGNVVLDVSWLGAGAVPGLPRAPARVRVVLGAEEATDAAAWLVPEWERIVATLQVP